MKFNFKKLEHVNVGAANIHKVATPFYLINDQSSNTIRTKVIFFGCDFKNMPKDVDMKKVLDITNRCLDYVRRECSDCELLYKPHPAETDESQSLNLDKFEMVEDRSIGEYFLYKNINQIRYVFSPFSWVSMSAYTLGLNSYVFARLYVDAFGKISAPEFKNYLGGMSEKFFITDLTSKLADNKVTLQKDELLLNKWAEILKNNPGTVWQICHDPGFLPIMISFSKMIKTISPNRKVGLILVKQERWNLMNMNEIMSNFDDLRFFPVTIESLRPSNLWKVFKVAMGVLFFKVWSGDILVGIGPCSLLINCFVSYKKNAFSVGLITQKNFDLNHNFVEPIDDSSYYIKPTRMLFINFIEPLLGLNKTVSRLEKPGGRGGFGISRYQIALNRVFDEVFILKTDN